MTEQINLEDWYEPAKAAERLSRNSGKEVSVDYVRDLARQGKITVLKLGSHARLYLKADIDRYIVEERGKKSGRAKRVAAGKRGSNR